MQTISLCMIVKNEEAVLERCLDSVRGIADEIIIVDTGSADHTKQLADKFTDCVYDFAWRNDFAAARNFAFKKATKDYILWLDADDILLENDRIRFQALKKSFDGSVDVYMMRYNTGFDAQGNVTFSYFRERLVRRSCAFRWDEPVHEYLEFSGSLASADVCVTHTKTDYTPTGRNIAIYERLLGQGKALTPRGLYYYARELKDNGRAEEAIRCFERFLADGAGWVEDNINACAELARLYSAQGMPELAFRSLTRSFYYDTPRAEICCELGYFYKGKEDDQRAVFWFKLATTLEKPKDSWGFVQNNCWGYIPYMELTVCCDRLGLVKNAERYNELAGKCKPNDPSVEYNRKYFQNKRKEKLKKSPGK